MRNFLLPGARVLGRDGQVFSIAAHETQAIDQFPQENVRSCNVVALLTRDQFQTSRLMKNSQCVRMPKCDHRLAERQLQRLDGVFTVDDPSITQLGMN